MKANVKCPNGHVVTVPSDLDGRQIQCPVCSGKFAVRLPTQASGQSAMFEGSDPAANQRDALARPTGNLQTSGFGSSAGIPREPLLQEVVTHSNAYAPLVRHIEEPETEREGLPLLRIVGLGVAGCTVLLVGLGALSWMLISGSSVSSEPVVASAPVTGPSKEQTVVADEGLRSPKSEVSGETSSSWKPENGQTVSDWATRESSGTSQAASSNLGAARAVRKRSKMKVLFGFDQERREQLSSYLQAHGYPKGKAGLAILKLLGQLNGVAKALELEPDEFNYVDMPAGAFKDFRSTFETGDLFETEVLVPELPDEFLVVKDDYKAGILEEGDLENAYLVFLGYWVEDEE